MWVLPRNRSTSQDQALAIQASTRICVRWECDAVQPIVSGWVKATSIWVPIGVQIWQNQLDRREIDPAKKTIASGLLFAICSI